MDAPVSTSASIEVQRSRCGSPMSICIVKVPMYLWFQTALRLASLT